MKVYILKKLPKEIAPQGLVVAEEINKAGAEGITKKSLVAAVKRRLRKSEAKDISSTVSFYLYKLKNELSLLKVKTVDA